MQSLNKLQNERKFKFQEINIDKNFCDGRFEYCVIHINDNIKLENCLFVQCNIIKVYKAELYNCNFDMCKFESMNEILSSKSDFINCTFSNIEKSSFTDNEFERNSIFKIANSKFKNCEFFNNKFLGILFNNYFSLDRFEFSQFLTSMIDIFYDKYEYNKEKDLLNEFGTDNYKQYKKELANKLFAFDAQQHHDLKLFKEWSLNDDCPYYNSSNKPELNFNTNYQYYNQKLFNKYKNITMKQIVIEILCSQHNRLVYFTDENSGEKLVFTKKNLRKYCRKNIHGMI